MPKTLRDWLPREALCYSGDAFLKHLDQEVVQEYTLGEPRSWRRWPGRHKNVMHWCVLANGRAVGWNENCSVGWSFPVILMKDR